jgi:hypothetical protein
MVVIKERKLLRCCFNCANYELGVLSDKKGATAIKGCNTNKYRKQTPEPTGICECFIRSVDNDRTDVTEVVQGQEPEEV